MIRQFMKLQTQVGLESVFAEYNTYLWEEYRLLACEKERVCESFVQNNENRGMDSWFDTNFYQFAVKEMELEGYTRLTDGDGKAYIQAAAGYMEENMMYETARKIYNYYEGMKEIQSNSKFDVSMIDKALKEMEKEVSVGSNGMLSTSISSTEEQPKEIDTQRLENYKKQKNLLDIIKALQKKGILSLVIEDTSQLSEKEVDLTKLVSKRELLESYNPKWEEPDWYDRVLFQQYILTYMSNYRENKNHSMAYEVEYLLGGKKSDIENMKAVVNQLLGMREAANFLYLINNPAKVEEAHLLALAIAGISVNPVVIEAVKLAVLSAWAFAESILDVRTLLTGGKISLLKSDNTWTMDIEGISRIAEGYIKAEHCKDGLSYADYLGILLLFQKENQVAKRGMDVQELTLRDKYGSESICLDEWILDVEANVIYEYKPVFFSIESMLPHWNYEISVRDSYEYRGP